MAPAVPSRFHPGYFRTLGVCWAIYGAVRLLIALWMAVFAPTATLMFGALLGRVPDPYSLMGAFHFVYLVAVIWSAASGILGIIAGLALLSGKWGGARLLAICAAILSLCEIPLGLTLGAYTLIVLLPANAQRSFIGVPRAA
jgi:hypothetical protein